MKRKVIQAELRKESESHNGWFKYDITIQDVDGSVDTVPAYGKDLQDSLSRVVHDEKICKIEKKTKRIPDLVWVVLWFGYIIGWTQLSFELSIENSFRGGFFLIGLTFVTVIVIAAKTWFRRRNVSK